MTGAGYQVVSGESRDAPAGVISMNGSCGRRIRQLVSMILVVILLLLPAPCCLQDCPVAG